MATTIVKNRQLSFCQLCLKIKSCNNTITPFAGNKRAIVNRSEQLIQKPYGLRYLRENALSTRKNNTTGRWKHTKCLRFLSTNNSLLSPLHEDLEDIRVLLKSKLTHGEQVSADLLESQMNVVDILLKNRLKGTSEDELASVASILNSTQMYSLASSIFSLQTKVGEEAGVVAAPLFKHAALAGNKNAKYSYGQLLVRGSAGLQADPLEAASLFTELAKEGHPYAQFALAGMYYTGFGIEQSFETAYTLYQVASDNGVVQSYNSIGKLYLQGEGVKKDEAEALKYFMKGAEAEDPQACMSVAHCYSHKKGVEMDYNKAFLYHQKAANQDYPPAIYNIGTHYFSGKGVTLDMNKAAECFQRAADLGFTLAEVNLGNMYYHGLGVEQNLQKAKELYQRAAPKHHNARLLLEELELEEKKLAADKDGDNN